MLLSPAADFGLLMFQVASFHVLIAHCCVLTCPAVAWVDFNTNLLLLKKNLKYIFQFKTHHPLNFSFSSALYAFICPFVGIYPISARRPAGMWQEAARCRRRVERGANFLFGLRWPFFWLRPSRQRQRPECLCFTLFSRVQPCPLTWFFLVGGEATASVFRRAQGRGVGTPFRCDFDN